MSAGGPVAGTDAGVPTTRPGLTRGRIALIAVLALALHVGGLAGPFTDGQNGNCGAMFALFARNVQALGFFATHGVPVVNPVPPAGVADAEFYSHHPPGLPWLVMLSSLLPLDIEPAARLVALLATLATALLLADLATRLAGRHAGLAAAVLALALPAGLHHGLLVNYETLAMLAMLALLRGILLERPRTWLLAALAALADYVALLPLVLAVRVPPRRLWWAAVAAAMVVLCAGALLARSARPAAVGDVLAQGLATTFLAPDFHAAEWLAAMREHLLALYGWALLPALVALGLLSRRSALLQRALLALLAIGVLNVTLFARHATGHEHFSLLLLPYVVLATATLLFPREQAASPPAAVGTLLLVVVLTLSWQQFRSETPTRASTIQARLADSLRLATTTASDTIYVRPSGAGFVFLQRCERYVVPGGATSYAAAEQAARAYAERFNLDLATFAVAIAPGESAPEWTRSPDMPEGVARLGWHFIERPLVR